MIDCGIDAATLDETIEQMKAHLGLKALDAILVTDMHGDHVLGALTAPEVGRQALDPRLRGRKFEQPEGSTTPPRPGPTGRTMWADQVRPRLQARPEDRMGRLRADRGLDARPDGIRLLHPRLRSTAGTWPSPATTVRRPRDPAQDGHEAVSPTTARILEEGYIYGAEYLRKLQPDLIVAGHSFIMDRPKDLIQRYMQMVPRHA